MRVHPDYRGQSPEFLYRVGMPVMISTGQRVPVNPCSHCGRADWRWEELTWEEAIERGIIIEED